MNKHEQNLFEKIYNFINFIKRCNNDVIPEDILCGNITRKKLLGSLAPIKRIF